ncbi:glycosyltransferase involved in cell wall biosynthesis [Hymenobacter luteus]|uniref:Glycosyltransferase involved in cell wall biosynthesis n=2 Tax=Hymenobacter TaxID=89966 RepID=A0A7W9T5P1_9BACT|nr:MULTISPECIES: glycosyltransferase family 2 protein [Hymenobacter]MBB4602997.1 glycosyltransferase involved in cell wall biosynthesis [Hymenobacter latericoloratus]MBB6060889.1 glycosyltransferase involved in cell wall biosynthesis [Hymenobacter luteus]
MSKRLSQHFPVELSIVIPLLNEAESLPELTRWINRVLSQHGLTYEVLLIDDGSTDNSWEVIEELAANDVHLRGIRFNRNYGKSAALNVGFRETTGRVVCTMDADLQDSPEELPDLYRMITQQGYDLVSGWKKKRFDPLSKTIPTKLFNGVTRWISGIQLHDFNCGLKAYDSRVVKSVEVYGEMHRYIPVIAKWAGFRKIGEKVVQHQERKYGTTKFGLERFVYGFLDLMSITFVSRFRRRPMHFFGTLGSLSFLVGMLITLWLVGEKVWLANHNLHARDVTAQPLFFLALVAVIVGVQLFLAGFLAEMVQLNGSQRNDYLVREKLNLK